MAEHARTYGRRCLDGLAAILLLTVAAWGQGFIVPVQQALGKVGNGMIPISSATITVCAASSPSIPCSPPLTNTIFIDSALTQSKTNPFFADANGNYQFAIAPGQYTVTVTAAGFNGYSYQVHVPFSAIPTNPAAGQLLAGGIPSGVIAQTKSNYDVRDFGVDCTHTNDSTVAFQNMINTVPDYSSIVIPTNCYIKLSSTSPGNPAITMDRRVGLQFISAGRNGNSCNSTLGVFSPSGFDYTSTYSSGNQVFNINRSQSLLFDHLTIVTSNGGADQIFNVDQIGATPPITTRNDWNYICILNPSATRNANFMGWGFSRLQGSNVENQHLLSPDVTCSGSAPTSSTSNGTAVWQGNSPNQKNNLVIDLRTTNCSVDLNQTGSDNTMEYGLDSSGNLVYSMGGFNDEIRGFRAEAPVVNLVSVTNVGPHLIYHNDFANISGTGVDAPGGCGIMTMFNNEQDTLSQPTLNCHGNGGTAIFLNNRNANVQPTTVPGFFINPFSGFAFNGAFTQYDTHWLSLWMRLTPAVPASNTTGGNSPTPALIFDTLDNASNYNHFALQSQAGNGFNTVGMSLNYIGTNVGGLGANLGVFGIGATVLGMKVGPSPQSATTLPSVSRRGAAGSTTWTYLIQANTISGHSDCSTTGSMTTGAATLNGSNFNVLVWDPYPGAYSYAIYRTVAGGTPNTTGLIATVPAFSEISNSSTGTQGLSFADQGATGDSTTCPVGNTTGVAQFATAIQATGTAAVLAGTGACTTRSGQLGGSWSGQVTCTGTTGASTLTITPGATAPNGWFCAANDITHTLAGSQSTASTTAPVISFTSVTANDVVNFSCTEY